MSLNRGLALINLRSEQSSVNKKRFIIGSITIALACKRDKKESILWPTCLSRKFLRI